MAPHPHQAAFRGWESLALGKRFLAFALARWSPRAERLLADRKRVRFADVTGDVPETGPGSDRNLTYSPPVIGCVFSLLKVDFPDWRC